MIYASEQTNIIPYKHKMQAFYLSHAVRNSPGASEYQYPCNKRGNFTTDFAQLVIMISMSIKVSCTLKLLIVFFWPKYGFSGFRRLEGMYRNASKSFFKISNIG